MTNTRPKPAKAKGGKRVRKNPAASVLPFPPVPSASKAAYTLAESTHKRREELGRLPAEAPNILLVLLDDVGFGLFDVVGGEVNTPAFSRIAKEGICYNTFHTTSIARRPAPRCSRAATIIASTREPSLSAPWIGTATRE